MDIPPFVSVNCLVSLWLLACTPFVQSGMFCKMSSEKAQLNQLLKRIRKSQRKGGHKNKKLWSRVNGLNPSYLRRDC